MSERVIDIEFTVRLVVENAIAVTALTEDFGGDPLEYIKYLVREEGLLGCTNDEIELLSARERLRKESDG